MAGINSQKERSEPQNGQPRLSRLTRKAQVPCDEEDFLIDEPVQEKKASRQTLAEGNIKSSRGRLSQRVSQSTREVQSQSNKSTPKENQGSILRFLKQLPPKENELGTEEAASTLGECAHPNDFHDETTNKRYDSQPPRVVKKPNKLCSPSPSTEEAASKARKPELLYINDDDDGDLEANYRNSHGAIGELTKSPPLADQFGGKSTDFPATWAKYQIAGVVTLLSSDSSDHEKTEAELATVSIQSEKAKVGSSLVEKYSKVDRSTAREVLSLQDSQQSSTNPHDSIGDKEISEPDDYLELLENDVFCGKLDSFDDIEDENIGDSYDDAHYGDASNMDDMDDVDDVNDVGYIEEYDYGDDVNDDENLAGMQHHAKGKQVHVKEGVISTDSRLDSKRDEEKEEDDDDVDVYQFFTPISRLQSASSFDRQFRKESTPTKRARTEEKFVENLMARVKERRENKEATVAAKQQGGRAYNFRGRFRGRGRTRGGTRSATRGDPASSLVYDPTSVNAPARKRTFFKRFRKPGSKRANAASTSRSVAGIKGSPSRGRRGGTKLEP